ncbi:MAG: DUF5131 family protein [Bacteroidales bacterium]
MALNVSKGNMYEFVTHTWNTVKGICPHGCSYCYMHRFGNQKPVRFDPKELRTDLGAKENESDPDNFIFVGSSCDMFADAIPLDWAKRTTDYCKTFSGVQYLFQTKNPGRLFDSSLLPDKSILCTTIETNRWMPEIMKSCPTPFERADAMLNLYGAGWKIRKFLTIEPIMDFDVEDMLRLISMCNVEQVNIGADTGRNNLPEPSRAKIEKLMFGIAFMSHAIKIVVKPNMNRLLKQDIGVR